MPSRPVSRPEICAAIEGLRLLEFRYKGKPRTVEPYCHGWNAHGEERLRARQVGGETSSGYRFGKFWATTDMVDVRETDRPFVPDDPAYNPDDSAMAEIHCRVTARR